MVAGVDSRSAILRMANGSAGNDRYHGFDHMNMRTKLTLAFLGVALLVALGGYHAISVSKMALEKSIEEQAGVLARETLSESDMSVYMRIEQLRAYAERLAEEPALIRSNQQFARLDDIQKYIEEKDRAWRAADKEQVTLFMAGLIDSPLSEDLRRELEQKEFYRRMRGHEVFSEVFVTNQYGVNAAQTQKTTDYYQADEAWWQEAKKHGLYVADVEYDKSAGVYSTDICVRIEDKDGGFLGVLKYVVNHEEVIQFLRNREQSGEARFKLLTSDNRVIYATSGYSML